MGRENHYYDAGGRYEGSSREGKGGSTDHYDAGGRPAEAVGALNAEDPHLGPMPPGVPPPVLATGGSPLWRWEVCLK